MLIAKDLQRFITNEVKLYAQLPINPIECVRICCQFMKPANVVQETPKISSLEVEFTNFVNNTAGTQFSFTELMQFLVENSNKNSFEFKAFFRQQPRIQCEFTESDQQKQYKFIQLIHQQFVTEQYPLNNVLSYVICFVKQNFKAPQFGHPAPNTYQPAANLYEELKQQLTDCVNLNCQKQFSFEDLKRFLNDSTNKQAAQANYMALIRPVQFGIQEPALYLFKQLSAELPYDFKYETNLQALVEKVIKFVQRAEPTVAAYDNQIKLVNQQQAVGSQASMQKLFVNDYQRVKDLFFVLNPADPKAVLKLLVDLTEITIPEIFAQFTALKAEAEVAKIKEPKKYIEEVLGYLQKESISPLAFGKLLKIYADNLAKLKLEPQTLPPQCLLELFLVQLNIPFKTGAELDQQLPESIRQLPDKYTQLPGFIAEMKQFQEKDLDYLYNCLYVDQTAVIEGRNIEALRQCEGREFEPLFLKAQEDMGKGFE